MKTEAAHPESPAREAGRVRRRLGRAAACIVLLTCAAGADAQSTTVTLLGTGGGPIGRADRAGISSLVERGDARFLVDAGEGVVRQLAVAGVDAGSISTVFLTHLHDDHTAGLPALLSFAWTRGGRPMELVGPPRTKALLDGALAFMEPNVEIRSAEKPRAVAPRSLYRAREIVPGTAWQSGDVRVSVLENTHFHFPPGSPARRNRSYALRFDAPDRKIVFTGDTGPSEELARFAAGADLIVAELASAADTQRVPPDVREHMLTEHLSPAEAGRLAQRAGARELVLSHVGNVADADLAEIRRQFDGAVTVGRDLMKF